MYVNNVSKHGRGPATASRNYSSVIYLNISKLFDTKIVLSGHEHTA